MTQRQTILLFLISLLVFLVVASFQAVPGYMDAEYYFLGGRQLAMGEGFTEPIIWNFLDDPEGLPHPSHTYWMPLASIVAGASMGSTGIPTFVTARIGFIGAALLVPLITARLSFLISQNRHWAFVSGILSIASGFYLPYITTTDTFSISMVLGGLMFLTIPKVFSQKSWAVLAAGVLTGALHLSRVDGILWLPIMLLTVILGYRCAEPKKIFAIAMFFVLGYFLIMAPWMARNLSVSGSLLAPGGSRTIWLTNYDQLFSYPADQISFQDWWESGISEILQARSWALGINLKRTLVEQGGIFLFPFILLGLWRLRSSPLIHTVITAWLVAFVLMTFIFPFAGARGGLFHACAVFQPLFWAVVPLGFSIFLAWGERARGWVPNQANKVFGIGGIVLAVVLSIMVFYQKVIGPNPGNFQWEHTANHYQTVEQTLTYLGADQSDIVLVKNPPGYSSINHRDSIVIPDGRPQTLFEVASRYGARYIVLEADHSAGLDELYQYPQDSPPGISYIGNVDETVLFELK